MESSVSRRITLTVGGIVAVGLLCLALMYYGLLQAREAVREAGGVYEPLQAATSTMAGAVNGVCLRLLQYVDAPSPQLRTEILQDCTAFETAAAHYTRVAGTTSARLSGAALSTQSRTLRSMAEEIMTRKDRRDRVLAETDESIQIVMELANRLDSRIALADLDSISRQFEVKALAQAAEHLGVWRDKFLETPAADYRARIANAGRTAQESLARLHELGLSPEEREWSGALEDRLHAATTGIDRLLLLDEEVRSRTARLSELRGMAYRTLAEAEHVRAADARLSRGKADHAFAAVLVGTLFLVPGFLIVGIVAVICLVRSILLPVRHLVEGTTTVGAGDLSYRIPRPGRDELGTLARNFNHMVERLAATTVSKERLEHSEAELLRANEALKEADQRKNDFIAMLGHELRNPLAAIANATALLCAPDAGPVVVGRAKSSLERQVRHMARLIEDLLDVSRLTRSKVSLHRQTTDARTLIEHAAQLLAPHLESRHQHLSLTLPAEPVWVDVDPVRMEQVLGNLLSNASKYTDTHGQVAVSLWREPGDDAAAGASRAVIQVRDNGVGIAPEMLGSVFEVFAQADRTLDRSEGGLGLGLTLVRSLVEMHGGSVEAHSEGPGRGSEFTIRLPLATTPTIGSRPPSASSATAARAPVAAPVLVIDDNVDAAETLVDLLELWGYPARMAHDGPTGLALAREFKPQIVLLDLGLPGMDGYEVARALRAEPALEGLKLIAVTGYGQEEDRQRSAEAGFDYHLTKPVEPVTLHALIADL